MRAKVVIISNVTGCGLTQQGKERHKLVGVLDRTPPFIGLLLTPLFLQLAESLRAAILILYKNLTRTRVCVCAVKPFSI